ncbi:MAG: D-alanyl-D-alanine carboxypeptidase [Hoeflea sp.]|nr:D-alanyl-D-alanine carboxypeptidase [Alphaproteobacteria bacterium]MBV1726219.1 D-alanyl-D-alanine carboxypeptidase [Hoeflea sp.]MBU4545579.1 D-alanyl-D-alanine carboxypeptidase [Alphaproteobacteria bacterium]MBU4552189.1 D-alanyl-D-alanine carboxypeptidase [Alphaproteobacteria bacterium]MBV1762354.1 D-alanyl-D-alanine carboxypeptidase [Hoeflea sp.]
MANPRIAVDVNSGRVIEHEQAFQRWYPASLTKLMTAYVVFSAIRSGQMTTETPIAMSVHAAQEPPSKMYFKPGERFPLDSALKYLMVKSANDVAVAIAEAVSGSEEAFVRDMNAAALRIGMTSTRFVNPNGLPGSGQYTTARDMALLAVAIRRGFPEFAHYYSYEGFAIGTATHINYNLLMGRFPGADGMKTGFICASGFNQISSATRNGKIVVSVVLGAPSQEARAEESARLLNKALTETAPGGVTLSSLAPYGDGRDVVADISGDICSKAAREARYEGRDVEGKMVLDSPYLVALTREPRLVQAPAGPPAPSTEIALSRIPLPIARPSSALDGQVEPFAATAFTATAGSAAAAEAMPLRSSVPIPIPRPAN